MSIASFMGSRISITTNADLRYEGLLFDLNTDDATIVLQNVRCMGSEGRVKGGEIPPSNNVHDYIVFKGEDIKDIAVCEVQKEEAPPITPYNYPGMHGYMNGNHVTPSPMPMSPMVQPSFPNHGMLNHGMPPRMGINGMTNHPFANPQPNQMQAGLYSQDAQSFFHGGPAPTMDLNTNRMMDPQIMIPRSPDEMLHSFMKTAQPQQMDADVSDQEKFNLDEFDFGPDPFAETQSFGEEIGKAKNSFYDKTNGNQWKDTPKHFKGGSTTHNKTMDNGFPKQHKMPPKKGDQGLKKEKSKTDKSQEKKESTQDVSIPQTMERRTNREHALQPFYDKKSSFFDNISQEGQEKKGTQREDRMKQRENNMETFGEASVRFNNHQRGGRRGRGDGRRYRGRGRGNWHDTKQGGAPPKPNINAPETIV